MKRYTKKPVQIEAVQWDGNNTDEIIEWSEGKIVLTHTHPERLMISTLEGEMTAKPGAWIIKGVQGEFYPCKPDIFEATYEPTRSPTAQEIDYTDLIEFIDYSELFTEPRNKAEDPRRYRDSSRYNLLSPVVTYDNYACHGCYGCETGEEPCRGAQYEGLEIANVDPEMVLDEIFGPDSVPMPQVLIGKLHLDKVSTYRVESTGGYYGAEYDCFFSDEETVDLLTEEWAKWPNAKDRHQVYNYLTSKNQRILGLLPLDNLKESLRIENGKQIDAVESATKLAVRSLKIDKVVIPNKKHFDEVAPKAIPKGGIGGVIADGKLVDGYHRLKWLKEQSKRTSAKFIVLS